MMDHRKILLSGGLVLASGGYAWWQHPAPHPITLPATVSVTAPTAQAPVARKSESAPPPASIAMNQPSAIEAVPTPPAPSPIAAKPKTPKAAPAAAAAEAAPPAPPPEPLNAVQLAQQPVVSTGRYLDGEFVGNAFDGEWGPVQVKAIIRNGDLADVIVLEYPIHRQRSAEISEWAIPQLYEEAIKAQSADIDMVSQASFTSENFQESLASALARARKP